MKYAALFVFASILFLGFFAPAALAVDPACNPKVVGQVAVDNSPYCQTKPTDPTDIVMRITTVLSIIGGIVAVFMVIIGGFQYVTSAGDASKTAKARNTILYSLVGLVVVIFAPSIVGYIVSRL